MAGARDLLKMGTTDPNSQIRPNEIDKKRTARNTEDPKRQLNPLNSPRTSATLQCPSQTAQSSQKDSLHNPPIQKSSTSINGSSMDSTETHVSPAIPPLPGSNSPAPPMEELSTRQRSSSKSSSSKKSPSGSPLVGRFGARNGGEPTSDLRPKPARSTSQEGKEAKEGNFMNRVKASRQAAQTYGGIAAKITAKATANTAKALGERGQKAWGRIKTKTKSSKDSLSQHTVPQSQYLENYPNHKNRNSGIDVWGMGIRDATLKTRVTKEKLTEADSTAYWTPAVVFRCLQYLNVHGPLELGLYRVSGSTAVVDDLRAEFVKSRDVDLFDNQPNDIHTVTSLLKGYFRALPEPLLSSEAQKRIYEQIKDRPEPESPPQCFLDELSQLPPYNYYMLYSLTAHLSNVNKQSDVNKMNLSNLGMIFCSTLRIDRFCFNWLVSNWAECWQGCWTEQEELEKTDPAILKNKSLVELASPVPSSPIPSSVAPSTPPSPVPPSIAPSTPAPPSPNTTTNKQATTQLPPLTLVAENSSVANPRAAAPPQPLKEEVEIAVVSKVEAQTVLPESNIVRETQVSAPSTPYTPASFTMGDDRKMMNKSLEQSNGSRVDEVETSKDGEKGSGRYNNDEPLPNTTTTQLVALKLDAPPRAGAPKVGASKPANIQLPPPSPKPSNTTGLQLTLPPLAPISPLIANHP